jgi:hypothetical protein
MSNFYSFALLRDGEAEVSGGQLGGLKTGLVAESSSLSEALERL